MSRTAQPLEEKFWSKVNKTETCWLWTDAPDSAGYARIRWGGRYKSQTLAARDFAYDLFGNTKPEGTILACMCDNKLCVNPEHMRPMTQGELQARTLPTVEERFWSQVEKTDDCWLWTGSATGKGYGQICVTEPGKGTKHEYAHRLAYTWLVGPIPEGLTIDHLCRNQSCVNPSHLEVVTRAENTHRYFATITECPHGHPYTEENTLWTWTLSQNGKYYWKRHCAECNRQRVRESNRRKHEESNSH